MARAGVRLVIQSMDPLNEGPVLVARDEMERKLRHIPPPGSQREAQLVRQAERRRSSVESVIPDVYDLDKAELTDALSSMEFFANFTTAQLSKLREMLTLTRYAAGEAVFEQGDEGDAFYVVTKGEAEALRNGSVIDAETFHSWSCFGEAALLKNERRYATVRAKGPDELRVARCSRLDFETRLGPLSSLIPDRWGT